MQKNNIVKRISCGFMAFLIVVTTIFSAVLSFTKVTAQAQTISEDVSEGKKIVSVVYDDSYSMIRSGNWCYCNYAFQLFTSLCDSVENYFVTYMSNPGYSENLFYGDKQMGSIVESIRASNSTASATPMQSVESAYEKLKSVYSSNENDEYWLVVMSDGVFDEQTGANGKDLYSKLDEYSKEQMPNGTKVHSIYLNIGNDIAMGNNDNSSSNQIHIEQASNNEQIINALVDVAKLIFGYIEVQNVNFADYELTEPTKMSFNTKLSLSKLLVICNKSTAQVTSAIEKEHAAANNVSSVKLRYPVREKLTTDESLIGSNNTIDIDNSLQTGSYEINFSENVSSENVRVLVKPEVYMEISLYQTGDTQKISDYNAIKQSDRLDISCRLIEKVSKREVKPEEIADNYVYKLSALNEGDVLAQDNTNSLKNVRLALDLVDINASLKFNNNNYIDSAIVIKPIPYVIYRIEGTTADSGKYNVEQMAGHNVLVHFTVYGNDVKLERKDIQDLDIKFYPVENQSLYKMQKNCKSDGDVAVSARFGRNNALYKMMFLWLPTWVLRQPVISVAADLTSPYTGEHIVCIVDVELSRGPIWRVIVNILMPILILLIIIGFIFKKRFPGGAKLAYCFLKLDNDKVYAYKYEWETLRFERVIKRIVNEYISWRTFVPFVSERFEFEDGIICADSFVWSRNPRIRVIYNGDKKVSKACILDTRSISSNEDVNLHLNTSRIIEEYNNDNEVCLYLHEGVIFVLDDDARFYKFSE